MKNYYVMERAEGGYVVLRVQPDGTLTADAKHGRVRVHVTREAAERDAASSQTDADDAFDTY